MNDEFLELIRLLNAHDVEFMVVGAYALAIYLEPRFTEDLDIWINQTQANLLKFGQALEEFGIAVTEVNLQDFSSGRKLIRIGKVPCQVDFLSFLGSKELEFSFDEVAARTKLTDYFGVSFPVPCEQDLLDSKLAANRPKDLGDIARLRLLLSQRGTPSD